MQDPDAQVLARLRPRALHRAEQGRSLARNEVAALLTARDDDLDRLLTVAARTRDAAPWFAEGAWGRTAEGTRRVTYSRKVFVPLTHLCRDTCGYCTFAWPPKKDVPAYLAPEQVVDIARRGQQAGCKEVLFTLGDKPELRYPAAASWLDARGYATTLEYLRAVAIAVIEETGLLPHLNPGVLSWAELATLKQVSASMGIMLETTSTRLLAKGNAHFGAPDKDPEVRLRTLEDAGRLSVPFTSGLLVGIGETEAERADTLLALKDQHRRYGHLQEVIVQNFRAKPDTAMRSFPEPPFDELLSAVATARIVLGPTVHVQAPPNLSPATYGDLLRAGIDDWGGVSPVTPDHVNPEAPWPHLDELAARSAEHGFALTERLCTYPEWVTRPDPWLAGRMRAPVAALADEAGLARAGVRPQPQPWQDPEVTVTTTSAAMEAVIAGDEAGGSAADGRNARSAAADDALHRAVYGDLHQIAAGVLAANAPRVEGPARRSIRREVAAALARAQAGTVLDDAEALLLFDTTGAELEALAAAADELRRDAVGDTVTYVVNRNLNFTNICYTGCRFCAFAQRRDDPDAYNLSLTQIADRVQEAWDEGATEVCMQGGIHPDLPGDHYFAILDAVTARVPGIHVHAFSPMEVVNGATRLGISVREWLAEAKRRGLGSVPGTAAEILDDEVRWVLTKGKLPAAQWIEVITTAHELGIPTTSTMMFGHVDEPRHWVAHLKLLRAIQEDTGGFTEFVPLPFVHQLAPIYLAGVARPGASFEDSRRVHAVARLLLHGAIDHVQCSWVKLGLEGAVALLQGGCDDLGGTLMEETISRMAGSTHGVRQDPQSLVATAAAAGRPAAERDTLYQPVDRRRLGLPALPV
ncbi:bifunctional FO biosynthesis protein CofGH [Egicoccus halophilus]|uniref:FO synthase n=1 Tax=Egicoccus halophilus TaxID=1670830 RepID=A0A8J3A4N8_9ACTN|nr:bifunctional FO biosynthesis protein CofGH [Egicoccus halophilus]GGI02537.1 FO synthase [Egicoccus halophilus]